MCTESSVEIIESNDYGDQKPKTNAIATILQRHKKSNQTPLEILVKDSNCSINKKHGYIINNATGLFITPKMLFEYQGIASDGNLRCPLSKCLEPVSFDQILYHFEDHQLSLAKVCDLWKREFHLWDQHDGQFWYRGERIAA